jgi:hypothetical protein
MNCQEFETVVRDLARAQVSDSVTREPLLAREHAQTCELCELKLQEERELTRKLAAVAALKSEPSRHVESALLQAYRETRSDISAAPKIAVSVSVFRRPVYWVTAAAAALLIVFAVAVLRLELTSPNPGINPASASSRVARSADATGSVGLKPLSNSIGEEPITVSPRKARRINHRAPNRVVGRVLPQVADANPIEPEIATQFIALSAAGPQSLQDGGQIVRVELSRLAMASFGLPVNMDRSGERVKADVLLSADGFARAIRFIQ